MPVAAASGTLPFAVEFGRPASVGTRSERGPGLQLTLPILGGLDREAIFSEGGAASENRGLRLLESGELFIGWATEPVKNDRNLQSQTQELYGRVLAATKGRHLYRIWNYVPRINALTDGFENYQAFCQGRSLAFEATLGKAFPRLLSAASAARAK